MARFLSKWGSMKYSAGAGQGWGWRMKGHLGLLRGAQEAPLLVLVRLVGGDPKATAKCRHPQLRGIQTVTVKGEAPEGMLARPAVDFRERARPRVAEQGRRLQGHWPRWIEGASFDQSGHSCSCRFLS